MPVLFNRVGVSSTTTGSSTITLASSGLPAGTSVNSCPFFSFSSAGVANGQVVPYLILDGNGNIEYGTGTYSSDTLTRTLGASNTGALLNLSGASQVFLTARSTDIFNTADALGTAQVATQADQEAAISTSLAVTPGRQQFHPSAAKAWVKFNSAGTVAASYNITSVTDNGTGDWTVNIATDFSSANYGAAGLIGKLDATSPLIINAGSGAPTAGTMQIQAESDASLINDPTSPDAIWVVFFGDQ